MDLRALDDRNGNTLRCRDLKAASLAEGVLSCLYMSHRCAVKEKASGPPSCEATVSTSGPEEGAGAETRLATTPAVASDTERGGNEFEISTCSNLREILERASAFEGKDVSQWSNVFDGREGLNVNDVLGASFINFQSGSIPKWGQWGGDYDFK